VINAGCAPGWIRTTGCSGNILLIVSSVERSPVPEEQRFDVEFKPFAVNRKARCYWDTELWRKNMEFIRDIDSEYFYYATIAHRGHLQRFSAVLNQ
jgi:hypothetical protein